MVVVEFPKELSERPKDSTPVFDAVALTNDAGLAHIVLNDQTYTLRITKSGKLILTK